MRVDIKDNTKKYMEAKDRAIEMALEMVGMKAEGHAKLNLTKSDTVDTGRLRNSITHSTKNTPAGLAYSWKASSKGRGTKAGSDTTTSKGGEKDHTVYIGTNVEYAPYIELGTSRMEPKPFLKPAITEHTAEYKRIIKNVLKGLLGGLGEL